jgi:peptidoglycan/LPS O-acetylase OafA/YrhL
MKERFEVLDIFRGIFASVVVLFHLSTFSDTPIINNQLVYNSDLFVDFFFVLSGFVIAYSYQNISNLSDFGHFYKKRFFRLYPLHVIMLFAFLVVEISKRFLSNYVHVNELNNPDNNLTTFLTSFFLVNSVKFPGVQDVSWNVPSWSISAEMIAYLTFGITMISIYRLKIHAKKTIIYASILVIAIALLYALTNGFKLTYSFDYGFLRAIIGFFTGVLCFNAYSLSKQSLKQLPNIYFHFAEAAALFFIFYCVWNKTYFTSFELFFEVLFFTTILIFAFEKGFISYQLKRIKLLRNIGKYSYSIYMTHALLLSIFNIIFIRLLKMPTSAYSYLFVLNYIIIYAVSAWTYQHIEMRFSLRPKNKVIKSVQ